MTINDTLKERSNNYGPFEEQGSLSQALKATARASIYWNHLEDYKKEAIEMILHKVSRIINGDSNYIDSYHDISGYAILVETILKEKNEKTNS